ncbi:OmpA family protein [Vibrio algarum]|uniref:OmpA family protein n=1 Tax=Vibrio algarum TaxID=3020714 RepID=A0ABT4YQU3_9VIBR|nr:OmpA family protein [Vibrio sp. KJ40-1]MDB1123931.1 OmpA family protein [Vibrio sp. KJ40-1]
MKSSTILLSLLTAGLTLSAQAEDQFDYIEAPVADQIADLQDDDKDGVINARDKCLDTVPLSQVDNVGCGAKIKAASELQLKVLFQNDSSTISPAFVNEIASMSGFLNQYPETSIELQGYASKVGNPEYNLELSKKRANEVKQSLIDAGVSYNRVKIIGHGDSDLIDTGESELAHALNRRVVATVVGYNSEILEEWTIFSRKKR